MGNQQDSKLKDFRYVHDVAHKQLGNIRILEYQGYHVFEVKLNSANEEQLLKRKELQHKNLVKLLNVSACGNPMMCTEMQQTLVVGEFYSYTLNDEAQKMISSRFNESKLWQLIYQLVDCCAFLNEKGKYHGDLRLQTIYLGEMGIVKLIEMEVCKEHDFFPGYPDAYNKAFVNDEFYHMSLEQLDDLRNVKPIQSQPYLSDVFTCGLLILELASQQCSSAYYNWQTKSIDMKKVNQTIDNLLFLGYSTILQRLIQQMISVERPNFVVIRDGLKKIEKEIIEEQPFYIQHLKDQGQIKGLGFETFGK